MSYLAYDNNVNSPTEAGRPLLSARSASNFVVAPMGNGRPARLLEKGEPKEDDPVAGMGFSILGSVIAGATGLGPLLEVAWEAMKTGLELSENDPGSTQIAPDVNLNPAMVVRPELAFNFRKRHDEDAIAAAERRAAELDARSGSGRTWNSGEGAYLDAQRKKRANSRGSMVAANMRGYGSTPSPR